jgi:hypothetical protein
METLRVAYGLTDEEIELYQEKLKNSMFTTDEARLHAIALAGAIKDIKDKYKLAAKQIDEYLNKLKLLPENSD